MNKQETIADVIAAMRGGPIPQHRHDRVLLRHFADRLEAARKREVDALKQRITELDAEIAAKDEVIKRLDDAIAEEQKRHLATTENSSEGGNCAKLREALSDACFAMFNLLRTQNGGYEEMANALDKAKATLALDKAKAALAAPPRNCDVYNNESCRMAYHLHGDGLMTMQAFADWLFAPATEKEGGYNGNE